MREIIEETRVHQMKYSKMQTTVLHLTPGRNAITANLQHTPPDNDTQQRRDRLHGMYIEQQDIDYQGYNRRNDKKIEACLVPPHQKQRSKHIAGTQQRQQQGYTPIVYLVICIKYFI